MRQSCGFWPETRLKIEKLRDFIITLLTNGMYLTDAHILTEELFWVLIMTNLVSIGSIKHVSIIYDALNLGKGLNWPIVGGGRMLIVWGYLKVLNSTHNDCKKWI